MTDKIKLANERALAEYPHLLFSWLPGGKVSGGNFLCADLSGQPGKSLSVRISDGVWKDFNGDVGGKDPVSLLAAIRGCRMIEAADEILGGDYSEPSNRAGGSKKQKDESKWEQLPFQPDELADPDICKFPIPDYGPPALAHHYTDSQGRTVGYSLRYETECQKRTFRQISPCRNAKTERVEWGWVMIKPPRPIYRILELDTDRPVLIVEGETNADLIAQMLPDYAVISWCGGSAAVEYTDWQPLVGRKPIIVPDCDETGYKAAGKIKLITGGNLCYLPDDAPEGYDLKDAHEKSGWDADRIRKYLTSETDPDPRWLPEVEPDETVEDFGDIPSDASEPGKTQETPKKTDGENWPFRPIGYNRGQYWYLSHTTGQVIKLGPDRHTRAHLLQLAPSSWWFEMFPGGGETPTVNWAGAADRLLQVQHATGIVDKSLIRGRGCWLEGDRVVYHVGDRLLVDSKPVSIRDHGGKYIYERGLSIQPETTNPAPDHESKKLLQLCDMVAWRNPIFARLLAGWIVLAPICGVLSWRPHLWLTAASGSGKSWLIKHIIKPIVGDSAIQGVTATSEAGLRRIVASDAFPIIFDEAEAENRNAQQRIQDTLELARQASSDSGGIIKASPDGGADQFFVRSMFCFSSVGVSAIQRADQRRITALEIVKYSDPDRFRELQDFWKNTAAKPSWCSAIRARTIQNAGVIASNITNFIDAVTDRVGDKGIGDQIGTLLGGAYSLYTSQEIEYEAAQEYVNKQDWGAVTITDQDTDELRCLAVLSGGIIDYEDDDGKRMRRTIGECVQRATSIHVFDTERNQLLDSLARCGIKIANDQVLIAGSNSELSRIYRDTIWIGKWRDQLSRIDPDLPQGKPARFAGSLQRSSAVRLSRFSDS